MNLSNELLFLLQGGAGAVSGYITNKYAVNMLFKEYTPIKLFKTLKFGGVVKNRKNEFIEEISALVERDIINSNTIISNLNDEKFEKVLYEIIKNFYNKELTTSFDKMHFDDFHDFKGIIDSMLSEFSNILKKDPYIIDTIIDKLDLNDNLTYDFINNISEGIYKGIVNELSHNNILSKSLKELYNTVSDVKVNEIVSQKQIELIEKSLMESIETSTNSLFEDDKKLSVILNNIYEQINIKDILNKLQGIFYEKKIGNYLLEDECESISTNLFDLLSSYVNSEEGQNALENLIYLILNTISDMNYTMYDLVPNDSKDIIKDFIDKNIHKIIPYFSEWIHKNKDNFDLIIEKSIDESIVNMDDGIKKLITSKVREVFLDNVSAKNEIVEKIIKYIENYNLDDNSLNEISNIVIHYLENTKISEMYKSTKDNKFIEDSVIDKILDFLKIQFNIHGKKIILNLLKSQLSKEIGTIFKKDLYDIFNDKFKILINNIIIINKENIIDIFKRNINNLIKENIEVIKNNRVDKYFNYSLIESNMDTINNFLCSILNKNEETIIKNFTMFMHNKLLKVKNDNFIKEILINNLVAIIKLNILEKGNLKISYAIQNNFCKDEIYLATSKITREILQDNLDSLLKGKIKETIKNNLSQYNEDEICDLAQRFMGDELKPLSLFGGILGFITGIIFGVFSRNIGINGFYENINEQILSIVLMGGVGIFTNVIAITMLFKPYTKNKFLAKIPFIKNFSLGYIPAHKNNISKGIGTVIDNDLLNSSYIKNLLSKHRRNLKTKLLKTLEYNNYNLISNFLYSHNEKIKNTIKKPFINLIMTNKNKIIKSIKIYSGNIKIDNSKLNKEIINNIIDSSCVEQKIRDISLDYMNNIINGSLNIDDIIYPELKYKIESYFKDSITNPINKLSDSIKNINMDNDTIGKYIYNSLNNKDLLSKLINNKSLSIGKNSVNYIQKLLCENLNKFIDIIIYEENTIETVFNGKIKIYIDKNLYNITKFTVNKVKVLLINNEDLINDNVKQKINESLNFFEKIGYAMANGDSIVDNTVRIMVEKNLPEFINERFYEVTGIIEKSLNNNIYKLKIKDIYPNMNTNNINMVINSVFEKINEDPKLIDNCENITMDIIYSCVGLINENNIKAILSRFNEETNFVFSKLSSNIIINEKAIRNICYDIFKDYILKSVYSIQMKNIFKDYNNEDLFIAINKFFNKINMKDFIKDESFILLSEWISNKHISDIINILKTEAYIDKKFNDLFNSEEIKITFEQLLSELYDRLFENIILKLDYKTKTQIIDKLLDALLNTAINNAKDVIDSLDLKEITRKQIEIMDPKELHMLFLSFAGPLFKKIYLYGIYGAIFGINLWIPVIFGLKEGISSIKSNNDVIKESKNTL